MPTEQNRLNERWERGKYTHDCWELHASINKLIAACAYDIVGEGFDPQTRKRQLCAEIEAVSKRYLNEEESQHGRQQAKAAKAQFNPEILYLFECKAGHRISSQGTNQTRSGCSRCAGAFSLLVAIPREEGESPDAHHRRTLAWRKPREN